MPNLVRIGTRGSKLALWQANWVAAKLREAGEKVEIIIVSTHGDRNQTATLANIGAPGIFTKEIQRALLNGEIDLAVHSLKDLPTDHVPGIVLAAVPQRASFCDALLCHARLRPTTTSLETLPEGARIGTGSVRRQTQIAHLYGNRFRIADIRGNLETRLRKLDDGEFDALILAEAGLQRLGFSDRITLRLVPPGFFPAVGQGALGLEVRNSDMEENVTLSDLLQKAGLHDRASFLAVLAERAFLQTLQGGCTAPIAALGQVMAPLKVLRLHGRLLSSDGRQMVEAVRDVSLDNDPVDNAVALGQRLAEQIAEKAAGIISSFAPKVTI